MHITVAVLTPTFLVLGWWQLHRALAGNTLSWAYTFEWPIFAVYGVYMWWKLVHDQDLRPQSAKSPEEGVPSGDKENQSCTPEIPVDEAEEKRLAAYNAYLARLHAEDQHDRR